MSIGLFGVLRGAIGIVVAASALSTAAQAQRAGGMAACRTDIATFCQGIEAGGGKRLQCLAANQAKLSPECATAIQARTEQRAAGSGPAQGGPFAGPPGAPQGGGAGLGGPGVQQPPAGAGPVQGGATSPFARGLRPMAACRTDVATFCGSVAPGAGGRIRCLRDNQANLSAPCRDALVAVAETRHAQRIACRADAQRLCGLERGPARRQCLTENIAQVSAQCQAALSQRGGGGSARQ